MHGYPVPSRTHLNVGRVQPRVSLCSNTGRGRTTRRLSAASWKFLSEEIFSVSLFIGRVNRKGRVTAGQIADCGFPLPRWQRYFEFIFKNTRRHSSCPYGNKRNLNEISAHLENLFGGDTKRSLGRKRGMKRHRQLREEGSGNAGRSPPHRAERDARKGTPIRATRPNTIRSTR